MHIAREPRDRRRGDPRGFTLLELLVGLSLFAVVVGITAPGMLEIRDKYRLDGVTRELSMVLTKARMQAIAQNRLIRVRFPGLTSYVIESSEDGLLYEAIGDPVSIPDNMLLLPSGPASFDRQGIAAESVQITIYTKVGTTKIAMTSLGRVSRL